MTTFTDKIKTLFDEIDTRLAAITEHYETVHSNSEGERETSADDILAQLQNIHGFLSDCRDACADHDDLPEADEPDED